MIQRHLNMSGLLAVPREERFEFAPRDDREWKWPRYEVLQSGAPSFVPRRLKANLEEKLGMSLSKHEAIIDAITRKIETTLGKFGAKTMGGGMRKRSPAADAGE